MELATIKTIRDETDLEKLCKYLTASASNSADRTQSLRDLAENEFIPEEMFHRFVESEKLYMLKEIQNYIDLYKGLN